MQFNEVFSTEPFLLTFFRFYFLCSGYEDDEDFRLTKEDIAEVDDPPKLFVLLGTRGTCKTAIVHTCALQTGFKVVA